ncbi:MAG: hypothetical protein ACM3PF_08880 [Bacteroidota bacterium]
MVPKPFEYPALTTPESTLMNVKYAWERRDSTRTKLIYADDYMGTSTDQADNSTLTFAKNQEVAAVAAMEQSTHVTRVTMDLKPATWNRFRYVSDPPGWTAIQMNGVNIQVDDNQYGTMVANNDAFFEFKLKPASVSGPDTTWAIVRWTELHL